MVTGNQFDNRLGKYSQRVDDEIRNLFKECPDFEMYDHLSYFMGFKNEKLEDDDVYAGKRFRANIALMIAQYYDNLEQVIPAAVSIEMFHNFTLLHDDIADGDTLRRGRPTVWKLFGVNHAINGGDSQMMLSLKCLLEADSLSSEQKVSVQSFLIQQYLRVIEGQYLDFSMSDINLSAGVLTEADYIKMIGRKTSDLIAAATAVPALLAKASELEVKALHDYGYQLGLIYQLCDDIISIWGKKEQTGKRECGDLYAKKKTLPILWWYQNASAKDREIMSGLYDSEKDITQQAVQEVLALLDSVNTYDVMMDRVEVEVEKAKEAVENLSFNEEQKQSLLNIINVLRVDIKNV